MLRFSRVVIIFVLVAVGSQQILGSPGSKHIHKKHKKESGGHNKHKAESVLKILKNLPGYYGKAVELWQTFEELHDAFATTPRYQKIDTDARLDALTSKVDKLAASMQSFEERTFEKIDSKYDRKSVEDKLHIIKQEMELINAEYNYFLSITDPNKSGQEYFILKWAMRILDDPLRFTVPLIKIKTSLLAGLIDFDTNHNNILDLLAAPNLVNELMCVRRKSAQQSIHTLYEHITLTEVRSYLMRLFSIEIVNQLKKQTFDNEDIKGDCIARMNEIHERVKIALTGASRAVWRCDRHFVEGQTYSMLQPIFQKYVLNEAETHAERKPKTLLGKLQKLIIDYTKNDGWKKGCEKACPDMTNLSIKNCKYDVCTYLGSKKCTGILRDCEYKHSDITVCLSNSSSYRRYEHIKTGNGKFYGVKSDCTNLEIESSSEFYNFLDESNCDFCLCTCDSSNNIDIGVFIDARPVESDIDQSKVVTGIRIVNGDAIHFEITEGKLLPSGHINSSTLNIAEAPYRNRSFIENEDDGTLRANFPRIRWNRRTICLDDLESSEQNQVLTGIKFELTENKEIELAIRLTPFDFYTGELRKGRSRWKTHRDFPGAPERSKLSVKYHDIPKGKDANVPRSRPGQCLEFHTSGLEQDAGQTVVPFIDIQPVTTNPPMPLSGAGLFLRGSDTTGGFLTPKLFTLNLEPYMSKPKLDGE